MNNKLETTTKWVNKVNPKDQKRKEKRVFLYFEWNLFNLKENTKTQLKRLIHFFLHFRDELFCIFLLNKRIIYFLNFVLICI